MATTFSMFRHRAATNISWPNFPTQEKVQPYTCVTNQRHEAQSLRFAIQTFVMLHDEHHLKEKFSSIYGKEYQDQRPFVYYAHGLYHSLFLYLDFQPKQHKGK